jgi:hypothetical protein
MALQMAKSGMPAIIASCSHKTFYAEYSHNGCKPLVKEAIIRWAADGDENRGNSTGIGYKRRYRYKRIKKKKNR